MQIKKRSRLHRSHQQRNQGTYSGVNVDNKFYMPEMLKNNQMKCSKLDPVSVIKNMEPSLLSTPVAEAGNITGYCVDNSFDISKLQEDDKITCSETEPVNVDHIKELSLLPTPLWQKQGVVWIIRLSCRKMTNVYIQRNKLELRSKTMSHLHCWY